MVVVDIASTRGSSTLPGIAVSGRGGARRIGRRPREGGAVHPLSAGELLGAALEPTGAGGPDSAVLLQTAASTQLQGYAAADGGDGRGIYLVFWFGNEASPTPARPDGSDGPRSARELESMLVGDLAPDLRAHTDVIVFDVCDPEAPTTAPPRRRRRPKTTGIAAAPSGQIQTDGTHRI